MLQTGLWQLLSGVNDVFVDELCTHTGFLHILCLKIPCTTEHQFPVIIAAICPVQRPSSGVDIPTGRHRQAPPDEQRLAGCGLLVLQVEPCLA